MVRGLDRIVHGVMPEAEKEGLLFRELYLACENIDLMVTEAWRYGGIPETNAFLDAIDVTEHCLTRLAAEVSN